LREVWHSSKRVEMKKDPCDPAAEPLLKVEEGIVDQDDDEKNKTALERLKGAKDELVSRSPREWGMFLIQNIPLLILLLMSTISLFGVAYWESEHMIAKISSFSLLIWALMANLGSWSGTVQVYYSVSLQEQIDKLRGVNKKLANNVDSLKGINKNLEDSVSKLKKTADDLQDQLNGFQHLRQQMEKYASESGANVKDFKAVMEESKTMFANLEQMTRENNSTLLYKVAQDLEFMDRDVGLSKVEFDRFVERIPEKLLTEYEKMKQGKGLKSNTAMFKDMASKEPGRENIDYKDLKDFIESLLDSVK